jgi:putative oxidoreductase
MGVEKAGRWESIGLFILRVGVGLIMIGHGFPKLLAGPETWTNLGQAMGIFGITSSPVIWGFLAVFAELGGGLALVLGFYSRRMSILLAGNMIVATAFVWDKAAKDGAGIGKIFGDITAPLTLAIVALAIIFLGPGRYSLDGFIANIKAQVKKTP